MISFNCNQCGKAFTVGDNLAGRKAKCKACGAAIVVPSATAPLDDDIARWMDPPAAQSTAGDGNYGSHENHGNHGSAWPAVNTPPPVMDNRFAAESTAPKKQKLPVRIRRLIADAELLTKSLQNFPLIQIYQSLGSPPELYRIAYNVRGLVRGPNGQPIYREGHVVEIQLTSEYPRQSPRCRMLTPVFHPNIEPAMICVGDHWTAAERLVDLVIRIGEMITFQAYNIKSPLDGEAAMWSDQNARHLPTDHRDLRPPGLD